MAWMNEYEIDRAVVMFKGHPILGPASQTLSNLRDATNGNSDGWVYWPKPARAAKRLMDLLQQGETRLRGYTWPLPPEVTLADYRKAVTPLKAFRTRSGLKFTIVEAAPVPDGTPGPQDLARKFPLGR